MSAASASRPAATDVRTLAEESLGRLRAHLDRSGFAGHDPYDALNSPLLRALSLGRKAPRIAFTQILRRLPWNLRPLLGIRPGLNPKALGLFLGGYSRLAGRDLASPHRPTVERLVELLEETRSRGCPGHGWGYNFDWQSRAFYVPRGTPTVVNSAFVGHALLDAFEIAGVERGLEMALPVRDFVLRGLHRTGDATSSAFSYTPLDRLPVHNASLLGASFLVRLGRLSPDAEGRAAALAALRWSCERQRPDGSWPYAETGYQSWVDSFHTGFVLESIHRFLEAGEGGEWREGFERGVRFYAERFFLADGTPRYYHDATYPIDVHCPAQALAFFSLLAPAHAELVERVLRWMVGNLQDPRGHFCFRKGRLFVNRIPYVRWGQAWAFHALCRFLHEGSGGTARAEAA